MRFGYSFFLSGKVIRGNAIGKKIGFPTANIDTTKVQIPRTGVYAVRMIYKKKSYDAVANIGFNPTFQRDRLSVEVHIFDFSQAIYGKEIEVEFISRIRSEIEFESKDDLVVQIKKDIEQAKTILAKLN